MLLPAKPLAEGHDHDDHGHSHGLVDRSIVRSRAGIRDAAGRPQPPGGELRNEALDRYFRAFEEETLPAAACGSRIEKLSEKLRGLEARHEELALDEEEVPEPLSEKDVRALAAQVREVVEDGERRQQKALLQGFVQEIRVVSREEI